MGQECCEDKCCTTSSAKCECKKCCDEGADTGKMMIKLANEAWEELLKEKMQTLYEKSAGSKMNNAAQVSVEACMVYWNNKMKEQASHADFEEKLKRSMM